MKYFNSLNRDMKVQKNLESLTLWKSGIAIESIIFPLCKVDVLISSYNAYIGMV